MAGTVQHAPLFGRACWCVCILLLGTLRASNAAFAALGKGFFLHDLDIKSAFDWDGTGASVVADQVLKDSTCLDVSTNGWVPGNYEFYAEQKDFASSLGISTDVSVGYQGALFSASATVSTAFRSSSSSSTSVSSSSLRVTKSASHTSIDMDCLTAKTGLSAIFVADFEQLPVSLAYGSTGFMSTSTASDAAVWTEYAAFLNRWGSHVVTAVHSGAVAEILTTQTSESQMDSSSFQLEACAQASYAGMSVNACAGYDSSDFESSSSSSFSSTTLFYGGDLDLAAAATFDPSTAAVGAFIASGDETTPAFYTYTALWDLLDLAFTSGDNYKRLQILTAYYNTFLVDFTYGEVSDCALHGVDYGGQTDFNNNVANEPADSYQECQSLCADDSSCDIWTFNPDADNSCFLKDGITTQLWSGTTSGPSSCGTKQEAGYEILVAETAKDISFEPVPCNFPIASSDDCTKCGNVWKRYTATDYGKSYNCNCEDCGCSWWNCNTCCDTCYEDTTFAYCSSPQMATFPDDWVNPITATTHYSNPSDGGCLADELNVRINGYDGHICSPECEIDSSCSVDLPGVTATAFCGLANADGQQHCALQCNPNSKLNECGTAFCVSSQNSAISYCMYPRSAYAEYYYMYY